MLKSNHYFGTLILAGATIVLTLSSLDAQSQPPTELKSPVLFSSTNNSDAPTKQAHLTVDSQLAEASSALKDISSHLESIKKMLGAGPNYAQILTLLLSFMSAILTTWLALYLAKNRGREEKRQFCFHLQTQFDSPETFQCRYKAWLQMNQGDFANITTVSELLTGAHWTKEVSTVFHFFESLNRYCDEGLVDPSTAVKLFGRNYMMWHQDVLGRLKLDDNVKDYQRVWYNEILAFHKRVQNKN